MMKSFVTTILAAGLTAALASQAWAQSNAVPLPQLEPPKVDDKPVAKAKSKAKKVADAA